jgi:hypothetical protein
MQCNCLDIVMQIGKKMLLSSNQHLDIASSRLVELSHGEEVTHHFLIKC